MKKKQTNVDLNTHMKNKLGYVPDKGVGVDTLSSYQYWIFFRVKNFKAINPQSLTAWKVALNLSSIHSKNWKQTGCT